MPSAPVWVDCSRAAARSRQVTAARSRQVTAARSRQVTAARSRQATAARGCAASATASGRYLCGQPGRCTGRISRASLGRPHGTRRGPGGPGGPPVRHRAAGRRADAADTRMDMEAPRPWSLQPAESESRYPSRSRPTRTSACGPGTGPGPPGAPTHGCVDWAAQATPPDRTEWGRRDGDDGPGWNRWRAGRLPRAGPARAGSRRAAVGLGRFLRSRP
jgi:hypothetical protein